ncbi:MAG: pantetheine-phosphate adenylyltransferase [Anaerovoracaceae bacterium]|jgi:pantetheine-phosphate adenylyltransferase
MIKALYAGSFDPMTCGHFDLIKRSAKFCDELVVGVIRNPSKTPMFTAEERKIMIQEACRGLPNVQADTFEGLLADYVNEKGFNMVIRGLRSSTDFESELTMAQMNARLYEGDVETIFMATNPGYSFISSSMAKEVFMLGGSIDGLVPDTVLKFMKAKRG